MCVLYFDLRKINISSLALAFGLPQRQYCCVAFSILLQPQPRNLTSTSYPNPRPFLAQPVLIPSHIPPLGFPPLPPVPFNSPLASHSIPRTQNLLTSLTPNNSHHRSDYQAERSTWTRPHARNAVDEDNAALASRLVPPSSGLRFFRVATSNDLLVANPRLAYRQI